jgi:outer membrane murein-binding lipoprotein Lpp
MVTAFVAGLVVAGGTVLLLRDDAAPPTDVAARVVELGAQIERLERSVSQLSAIVARGTGNSAAQAVATGTTTVVAPAIQPMNDEQQRTLASAEAFVDQAIQAGQWTQHQQADLSALISELPVEEQGRIQARISKAINADQIKPELR